MNKHQYETQMETLEAQIRVENVRGKTQDVAKAKWDANTKQAVAKQAAVKSEIAIQNLTTETYHLAASRQETKMAKLHNEGREMEIKQLTRENPLRQKVLDMKYENLTVDSQTARKLLDDRKTYLKQLGNL